MVQRSAKQEAFVAVQSRAPTGVSALDVSGRAAQNCAQVRQNPNGWGTKGKIRTSPVQSLGP